MRLFKGRFPFWHIFLNWQSQTPPSKQLNLDLWIFTTMNDEMFGVPSRTFIRIPANVMSWKMYLVAILGTPLKISGWNVKTSPKIEIRKIIWNKPPWLLGSKCEFLGCVYSCWASPPKINISPKKGPFQQERYGDFVEFPRVYSVSICSIFVGVIARLVFWSASIALENEETHGILLKSNNGSVCDPKV